MFAMLVMLPSHLMIHQVEYHGLPQVPASQVLISKEDGRRLIEAVERPQARRPGLKLVSRLVVGFTSNDYQLILVPLVVETR